MVQPLKVQVVIFVKCKVALNARINVFSGFLYYYIGFCIA